MRSGEVRWGQVRWGEEKIEVEGIRHLTDDEQVEAITLQEVIETLEGMDPGKSTRPGDTPAKIFKRFAKYLAQPITLMINQAIKNGVWPDF